MNGSDSQVHLLDGVLDMVPDLVICPVHVVVNNLFLQFLLRYGNVNVKSLLQLLFLHLLIPGGFHLVLARSFPEGAVKQNTDVNKEADRSENNHAHAHLAAHSWVRQEV